MEKIKFTTIQKGILLSKPGPLPNYHYITESEWRLVKVSMLAVWLLIAIAAPTFLRCMHALYEGASIRDAILYAWGLL